VTTEINFERFRRSCIKKKNKAPWKKSKKEILLRRWCIHVAHGLIFVSSPSFIRRFSWQELRDSGRNDSFLGSFRIWASGLPVAFSWWIIPLFSYYLLLEMPTLSLAFAFTSGQSIQYFQYLTDLLAHFNSFFFEIYRMIIFVMFLFVAVLSPLFYKKECVLL